MKHIEILPNGIEVVFAFGKLRDCEHKKILFLAGTTSWKSDLVTESWRRYFLKCLGEIKTLRHRIVVCVPEPQHGVFEDTLNQHLIEWETECLDLAGIHAYWLNTYWTFEQAMTGCDASSLPYFCDGADANIGITVRSELGCSFGRYKYGGENLKLIVGAPHDAQGLAWLKVQSKMAGLPFYTLNDKTEIFDRDWFDAVVVELNS